VPYEPKKRLAFDRRTGSQRARPLSVSIYPQHERILEQCELEFNVSRSVLLGLWLELEQRDGMIRKEMVRRLRCKNWTTQIQQAA
jgi:hypothetical protein